MADKGIGLEGTAESADGVDLSEDPVATYEDLKGAAVAPGSSTELSTEDLSLLTKFGIFAVIVAACFAFVRSRSPRRTALAGRHGAYEKGSLP